MVAAWLSWYVKANLLILPACGLSLLFWYFATRFPHRFALSRVHRLQRVLVLSIVVLPCIAVILPKSSSFVPSAEIWAAPSMAEHAAPPTPIEKSLSISLPKSEAVNQVPITFSMLLFGIFGLGFVLYLSKVYRGMIGLRTIIGEALPIKTIGPVQIMVTRQSSVPFSFWLPGRNYAIMPEPILASPKNYLLSIRHELQHHRQGDTRWVYLLIVFRAVFFWNPLAHVWARQMNKIQEFACDEVLVDRKHVSPRAYGRCLLEVAAFALDATRPPVGTAAMAASASYKTLKRRIDMMFHYRSRTKPGTFILVLTTLLFMVSLAIAGNGLVKDRRVTMAEAREMAENVAQETDFPIVVNQAVLQQINRYVGTPDGRNFMRKALERMVNYQDMVESKIQKYGNPPELAALPILESGYQSLEPSANPKGAAGLWQFIPGTARQYNLRVDDKVDERLDDERATDAAMRLLSALNLRFQDWHLALLAYNSGGKIVQRGISETGQRDAWHLVRQGYQGDDHYLSKFMAVLLITKNPHILD